VVFKKLFSKLFCVYLLLEKLVNGKYFTVKEKFGLVSKKIFSFYFGQKHFPEVMKNFGNVILFADYIKFDPQTFDCYIYFVLNIFFNFIPYNLIFILTLIITFIIVICFFLVIF
jgi:hypothetical protein